MRLIHILGADEIAELSDGLVCEYGCPCRGAVHDAVEED